MDEAAAAAVLLVQAPAAEDMLDAASAVTAADRSSTRKRQRSSSPEPRDVQTSEAMPSTTEASHASPQSPAARARLATPEIPPEVKLLTTAEHWAAIAARMPEFPTCIAQFLHSLQASNDDDKKSGDSNEREPKYKVDRFQPDKFPKARGFLAHIAVMENDASVLRLLYQVQQIVSPGGLATQKFSFDDVLRCAVAFRRFRLLQWLVKTLSVDSNWRWEPDLMKVALKSSGGADSEIVGVELLDWLYTHCPKESVALSARDVDLTMGSSTVQVVRWLHDHEYPFSSKAMDVAAASGNLEIVRFLHTNRTEGCTTEAMNGAAGSDHLDVVRFLHERRTEGCTSQAMDRAAKNGHLGILTFLHENRKEGCTAGAMDGAAGNGHLHIVEYLHANRSEGCTAKAMDDAVDRGHLGVLQFLQSHRNEGFSPNRVVRWSAKNTDMGMVAFLHNHLPLKAWSEAAMDAAAAAGRLDVVHFLHEHRQEGCTTRAMDNAAKMGHLGVVQFLHEKRTEGCSIVALMQAMERGHEDVVKFLYTHRYKDNAPRSL